MHTAELSVDFMGTLETFPTSSIYVEMGKKKIYFGKRKLRMDTCFTKILKQNESNYNSIILKKMGIDRSIENIVQFSVKN